MSGDKKTREAERRTATGLDRNASDLGPDLVLVRAVEFVRKMRGASQPSLMRCDDGEDYVVKFRNNPQHIRILANELLAGRLALLLGLPVPGTALIDVSAELIAGNPALAFDLGRGRVQCHPGLSFGSRFPGPPGQTLVVDFLPDRLLRRIKSVDKVFLGALVFDKWTCNCDGRQVIFCRGDNPEGSGYSAALIDQGFCFNDGDWNFPDSPIRSLYPRRMVYERVRGLESFQPFLSRLENLDAAEIEDCARGIPDDWCGGEPEQLKRLLERLYDRRRRVRQAIIDAKNSSLAPFPNWK